MAKKRTRSQKVKAALKKQEIETLPIPQPESQSEALMPWVYESTHSSGGSSQKTRPKQSFAQEKSEIVRDLWKTLLYTLMITGVLFIIFVYTKSS